MHPPCLAYSFDFISLGALCNNTEAEFCNYSSCPDQLHLCVTGVGLHCLGSEAPVGHAEGGVGVQRFSVGS